MPNGMSGPRKVSTGPEVPMNGLTSEAGLVTSLGAEALVAAELVPATATVVPRAVAAVTSAYSTRRGRLRVMGVPFVGGAAVSGYASKTDVLNTKSTNNDADNDVNSADMRQ